MIAGQLLAKLVIPDRASAAIRGATRAADQPCALGPGSRSGIGVAHDVRCSGPRLAGMTVHAKA